MMPHANQKFLALQGGTGTEREVSLRSGANVAASLRMAIAQAVGCRDVKDENFIAPPGFYPAFNMVHGTLGEDGRLQENLDAQDACYTGEGTSGNRLGFDKVVSKQRFTENGVNSTPAYEVLNTDAKPTLSLPFVVKKAPRQGSSVGVYLCSTPEEAIVALCEVSQFGEDVLVDQLVSGRGIVCS